MKTAISLSDKLFHDADALARQLGISRSELYATALKELLERRESESVTARLNAVHAKADLRIEPANARSQAVPSSRQDHW